jgi:ferredoxin-type protein NapH
MNKFWVALKRHKWRYLAILAGFLLFVSPSALFIRGGLWLTGGTANPDMHALCFRMPFSWLAAGNFAAFDGRLFLLIFLGLVAVSSLVFGPLFCGWLCPIGSTSEMVSRPFPDKIKINLAKKVNPSALRYGFLASFLGVAALVAFAPGLDVGSICCRYCTSTQVQNLVSGIFNPVSLTYWTSGSLMVMGGWLLVGGIFWKGGRGWCLYGCPLGVASSGLHAIGSKIGLFKVKHNEDNCVGCGKCEAVCPTWALTRDEKKVDINRHVCNTCLECVKVCPQKCFKYESK